MGITGIFNKIVTLVNFLYKELSSIHILFYRDQNLTITLEFKSKDGSSPIFRESIHGKKELDLKKIETDLTE